MCPQATRLLVSPALLFLGLLFLLSAGSGLAEDEATAKSEKSQWLLPVSADEETMEKRIAAYVKKAHDIEAEYHFADEDDLVLKYVFSSDDAAFPEVPLIVDSEESNSVQLDDETIITERRVTLTAYYVLPDAMKTSEYRAQLLEVINLWHVGKWEPQRIYLDKDGDITMQSSINVPGKDFQVHAELVADQAFRMYSAWQEFYATLNSAEFASPAATPVASHTIAYRLPD